MRLRFIVAYILLFCYRLNAQQTYQLHNWHYGFYDIRVGVLIEIGCFSLALYYKTKEERLANLETKHRLVVLTAEHEALKHQVERMKIKVINGSVEKAKNDFILRGAKIVDLHLSDANFSVDEFAKEMQMNRSQLFKSWKEATEQTPNEYIQNSRLSHVQKLLLTTNLTVSEIAYQTGFREAAYLSRVFHQKFGQSPSEFRGK